LKEQPFVSVIVPCRNEESFIEDFIQNISAQDYPKGRFEVFIVDGQSDDQTRQMIKTCSEQHPYIKMVDNPSKTVPYALNLGVERSKGLCLIMGVHAAYPKNYISKLVEWHTRLDSDVTGGILRTKTKSNSAREKAIALAMSSLFGVGNSYFRIGSDRPLEVDTVPFGLYKRQIFKNIGLFNTDLTRNQDDEFNARIKKNGGRIFLIPEIEVDYYTRNSFSKLWTMYYQYGYFKPLVNKTTGQLISIRQLIPALFIVSLLFSLIASFFSDIFTAIFIIILILYAGTNMIFALFQAKCSPGLSGNLMFSFLILHLSYGMGYLKGIIDFLIFNKRKLIKNKQFETNR
jgi:glycosyltransferase involved in cell wall biosynthesis